MAKTLINLFIVLLVLISLFVLPFHASAAELIDQTGRRVNAPDNPKRVVSLAPSITEIIYSLGKENLLAAATQYSNYPAAARDLPRVGSYVRLDIEKIVALEPDICLGIKDGNPEHTVNMIESLGIPVYMIDPRNLNDISDVVRRFGVLLGAIPKSEGLIKDMQSRINAVERLAAETETRPKVFFQIDAAPIITAGNDTYIHELITLAGGRNLAAASQGYPRYNWEEVLKMGPDVVIVASMAGGHSPEELKAGWRKWPQVPAVVNNRIHVVDANMVDRPTPRLVEGVELFVRLIHPELFGDIRAE